MGQWGMFHGILERSQRSGERSRSNDPCRPKQSLECAMSQHTKKANRNFFIKQLDSCTWQIVMFIPCPYCFWLCSLCSLTRSQHLSMKHFIDLHFWPNFAATRLRGICTALQQQQDEILRKRRLVRVETKPSGV